ncbi:hypothetical protein K1719_027737 [Acacia pycnantha]|nr:hypothetical protein K1719_027737 [Acacia pycnantha]
MLRFVVRPVAWLSLVVDLQAPVELLPKGWGSVRSFHLKLLDSLALPLYQVIPDMKLKIEEDGVVEKEEDDDSERLEKDLLEESPQAARVKVLASGNATERRFSVWIGGSILASLGSFQQMWFSKSNQEVIYNKVVYDVRFTVNQAVEPVEKGITRFNEKLHKVLISLLLLLITTGETMGEVKVVADMHQRKAEMARHSDAFIA